MSKQIIHLRRKLRAYWWIPAIVIFGIVFASLISK